MYNQTPQPPARIKILQQKYLDSRFRAVPFHELSLPAGGGPGKGLCRGQTCKKFGGLVLAVELTSLRVFLTGETCASTRVRGIGYVTA
jgi:hypothetical protein